jgi:thioester reductase-like protein
MQYFVTGATGFIGKRLVKALLARRGAVVHFLVRPGSESKLPALREYWGAGAQRAHPVTGDLTTRKLGVTTEDIKALKGHVDTVYHLAAVYDLGADAESQIQVNIEGTRHVCEFAKAVEAGHLHHVSSIAAAGLYEGVFREDMFGEARIEALLRELAGAAPEAIVTGMMAAARDFCASRASSMSRVGPMPSRRCRPS